MPRRQNPEVEARILAAAHALWKRGGEKALTMRTVARAAKTNTPAVYRRFRNRHAIVRALLQRIQLDIAARLIRCRGIEAMGEAYIDYAINHPHEYRLFYAHARELAPRDSHLLPISEVLPNLAMMEKRLAERLGGAPKEHTQLALALWAAAHGTAMMLIAKVIPGRETEVRKAFGSAVKSMLRDAALVSSRVVSSRK